MTVKVSLTTNAKTPVTVNPTETPVNKGNATVIWKPASGQPDFTFVGVTIIPDGHFGKPEFNLPGEPAQMSVTELSPYSQGTNFYYQLTVNLNGKDYQSVPIARESFKPGDPVIHNN